jgi:hypothetical protein
MEIWKDIKGYEGIYEVSNTGLVRSLERVIIRSDNRKRTIKSKIKEGTHTKGYKRISLYSEDGSHKHYYVHRLVIASFKGESDLYVDHIDGNKQNNDISNLRYVTNSENLTFRNTDKTYSTKHPYVYHDKGRDEYRVYKFGKRFKSFEDAKNKAICLYGQRQ